ncbi:MAG: RHS repeat-associated core domain-containing protein [Anaerolineae bacterium]|nr:RHS repeat-associated core domain-containing protein [Anaerolineae bacterium]
MPYFYGAGLGGYRTPDWTQPKTQYSYDALGRVTQVTNPDGTAVRSYYQDRRVAVIDELNHQTIREMDGLGRLVSVKQFSGSYPGGPGWNDPPYSTTSYSYNVRDQLSSVTGPDGAQTTITYDLLGRKTQMSDPDMGTWTYAYDAAGNLTRQTDARNQTICFYYDALNRLKGKHYRADTSCPTSNPSLNVSYTYDQGTYGKGRRTGMTDGSGSTSWSYDARGRVTQESKVIGGVGGGTFVTQWGYDAMDRVVWMKYPGGDGGQVGEQVNFGYNPAAWLKSVVGASTYVGDTSYNALGQVELRRLGSTAGVLTTDYIYRSDNFRLQWIKTGSASPYEGLQNLEYAYDAVGNVLTIKDYKVAGGTQTQSFTYDFLDRVLSATVTGGSSGQGQYSESYTYNVVGNLMSKTGVGSYTYGTQAADCPEGALSKPHAVVTAGANTYCYDRNGNMVRRNVGTTYNLTYDAENRLTGVSGGASASFVYDGDGNRVKATFNGTTTVYIGDYYEQTGSTIKKYYYANGQRVAMRVGSTLYWLLTDHLGSTAITANSSGSRVAELRYKAWGETRYTDGITPTAYKFTGQRLDEGTGLYYYGARYYDPALGRFVQADTIVPEPGNPQALNRYSYVLNNRAISPRCD